MYVLTIRSTIISTLLTTIALARLLSSAVPALRTESLALPFKSKPPTKIPRKIHINSFYAHSQLFLAGRHVLRRRRIRDRCQHRSQIRTVQRTIQGRAGEYAGAHQRSQQSQDTGSRKGVRQTHEFVSVLQLERNICDLLSSFFIAFDEMIYFLCSYRWNHNMASSLFFLWMRAQKQAVRGCQRNVDGIFQGG